MTEVVIEVDKVSVVYPIANPFLNLLVIFMGLYYRPFTASADDAPTQGQRVGKEIILSLYTFHLPSV